MKSFLTLAVCCFAFIQAAAQDSLSRHDLSGLYVGAHVKGVGWNMWRTGSDPQFGAGIGLEAGYGFNPEVTLYARLAYVGLTTGAYDSHLMRQYDVGAQYHFVPRHRIMIPYLDIALIHQEQVTGSSSGRSVGAGLHVGGGVKVFRSTHAAIDIGILAQVVAVDDIGDSPIWTYADRHFGTARLHLGLIWYPDRAKRRPGGILDPI